MIELLLKGFLVAVFVVAAILCFGGIAIFSLFLWSGQDDPREQDHQDSL